MKNAVVIGVSGKLGSTVARKLSQEGYFVIGTYNENNPSKTLGLPSSKIKLIKLNMEDTNSMDSFASSLKDLASIDVFVNTVANMLTFAKFEDIGMQHFEKDIKVNYLNQVYLIKKLMNKFAKESSIIFVLTRMVDNPSRNFSSYISSKSALLGLMRSLSLEFEQKSIRVNAISPGGMDTNFTWNMRMNGKETTVPSAVKESTLKAGGLVSVDKVADKLMKIVADKKIKGQNVLVE